MWGCSASLAPLQGFGLVTQDLSRAAQRKCSISIRQHRQKNIVDMQRGGRKGKKEQKFSHFKYFPQRQQQQQLISAKATQLSPLMIFIRNIYFSSFFFSKPPNPPILCHATLITFYVTCSSFSLLLSPPTHTHIQT